MGHFSIVCADSPWLHTILITDITMITRISLATGVINVTTAWFQEVSFLESQFSWILAPHVKLFYITKSLSYEVIFRGQSLKYYASIMCGRSKTYFAKNGQKGQRKANIPELDQKCSMYDILGMGHYFYITFYYLAYWCIQKIKSEKCKLTDLN